MTSTKRSRFLSLLLISSLTLVSCAEEQYRTSRALYNTREDCEREWGVGSDACYISGSGYYYGPHFVYFGGRGYYYPYRNGVPGTRAQPAPPSAQFSATGALQSRGVVAGTSISRGGFGARGGFFGG
jgi:uncharacterized protein YgiB involved in biofilm formation